MKHLALLVALMAIARAASAQGLECSDHKSILAIFDSQGINPNSPALPSNVKLYKINGQRKNFLVELPCFYSSRVHPAADVPNGAYRCNSPAFPGYNVDLYDTDSFGQRLAGIKTDFNESEIVTSCEQTRVNQRGVIMTEIKLDVSALQSNSNIEVVKKYFEALKTGNMEQLSSVLSNDIIWHQPGKGLLSGIYQGKDKVFALFGQFMEISQGTFKINVVDYVAANEDYVTVQLSFSASNDLGSIAMRGIDVMKVKDGQIIEVWLFSEDQNAEDKFWNDISVSDTF